MILLHAYMRTLSKRAIIQMRGPETLEHYAIMPVVYGIFKHAWQVGSAGPLLQLGLPHN